MRGHYEVLLAEAARVVTRSLPGPKARVLMRVGGSWREWSALDGGRDSPDLSVPEDLNEWDQPRRLANRAFLPIAVGAVCMLIEDPPAEIETSDELEVFRRCF